MLRFCAAWVLLILCSINHAVAAQTERVVAVQKGGEIALEKSGRAVFRNIAVLDAALMETWLAEHALQKEITFSTGDEDRYGRQQITSDIQANMLRDGVALIYATDGTIAASWRAAEAQARSAKRGVWAKDSLAITPEKALALTGGFHSVEGTIIRIYESKTATYLNFGEDWHSDFSITISPKLRRSMKAFLANLKEGDRIRVRGSIVQENGPMIRLNHVGNVEKL
jgi:hypothetical protein